MKCPSVDVDVGHMRKRRLHGDGVLRWGIMSLSSSAEKWARISVNKFLEKEPSSSIYLAKDTTLYDKYIMSEIGKTCNHPKR